MRILQSIATAREKISLRFIIFLSIGLMNTAAYFVLTNILVYWVHVDVRVASYAVYAALVPVSFLGHSRITFRSNGAAGREWIRFCITQGTSLLIITAVTAWLKSSAGIPTWMGLAAISILIAGLNFVVMQVWVFANRS